MPTIKDIRQQYPQYDDLDDNQLASGLHSKFYSDMSFEDFSQKIGLTSNEPTLAGSFMHGAKSALSSAQTYGEALVGDKNKAAEEGIARSVELDKQYPSALDMGKITEAYNDPNRGVLPAAWETAKQAPYAVAENMAPMGAMALGAMAAPFVAPEAATALVGARALGAAGAFIPSASMQSGSNIERQASVQKESNQPVDINMTSAQLAGAAQGAIDVVGGGMTAGKALVGKMVGLGEKELAKVSAAELEKTAQQKITEAVARGTLHSALGEIPGEVSQQVLERWQAGLSLTDESAQKEYKETALYTALGTAPLGAAGGVYGRQDARNQIAKNESDAFKPAITSDDNTAPPPPSDAPIALENMVGNHDAVTGLKIKSVAPDTTITVDDAGNEQTHNTDELAAQLGVPAFAASVPASADPIVPESAPIQIAQAPAKTIMVPAKKPITAMPIVQSANSYILPKRLAKSAPRFSSTELNFENDLDKALYVIANPNLDSKAHDQFAKSLIEYGMTKPEIDAAKKQVKAGVKSLVYGKSFDGAAVIPQIYTQQQKTPTLSVVSAPIMVPAKKPKAKLEIALPPPNLPEHAPFMREAAATKSELVALDNQKPMRRETALKNLLGFKKPPVSLSQFVKNNGGFIDPGGEMASRGLSADGRTKEMGKGIIAKGKGGLGQTFDEFAAGESGVDGQTSEYMKQLAHEAGFKSIGGKYAENYDDIKNSDFWDAVDADAKEPDINKKIYDDDTMAALNDALAYDADGFIERNGRDGISSVDSVQDIAETLYEISVEKNEAEQRKSAENQNLIQNDEYMQFARGNENTGQDPSAVKAEAAKSFGSASAKLINSGKVVVVPTYSQLPARADGQGHDVSTVGMKAADGKVYLVANKIKKGQAAGLILHEVGVHVGMREMIGDAQFSEIMNLMETSDDAAVIRARKMVPSDTPAEHVNEETLAYLVQTAPKSNIVQRLFDAIRAWVYKSYGKGVKLNEGLLRELAIGAVKRVSKADGASNTKESTYSKEPAQSEISGAEKISDKQLAERKMEQPLRSDKTQKPADEGLFGSTEKQIELFSKLSASTPEQIGQSTKLNKDIKLLMMLLTPWQIAKYSKLVSDIYTVVKSRATQAEHYNHEFVKMQKPYRDLPSKIRTKVADYAREASGNLETLAKEENGDFGGLNEQEIAALQAMRESFKLVGPTFARAYAANAGIENTSDKSLPQIKSEIEEKLKDKKIKETDKIHLQRAIDAIQQIRFTVPNYWPRIRTGNYWFHVVDKNGEVVLNDQINGNTMADKMMREFSSSRGVTIERTLADLQKEYPADKGFVIKHDYVNRASNPVRSGFDQNTIDKLNEAAARIDGDKTQFYQAMNEIIGNLSEARKPSFMRQTQNIKGLSKQPHDDIIDIYTNMVSHIPARLAYEQRWTDATNNISKGKPNEQSYAKNYVKYINEQNSAVLSSIRLWTFYSAFALKPLTPIANWGSIHTVFAPLMGQYSSTTKTHAALVKQFNGMRKGIVWDKEKGLVFDPDKAIMRADTRKAAKGSRELQNYNASDLQGKEAMDTLKGKMTAEAVNAYQRVAIWSASAMSASEQFARHHAFSVAYEDFADNVKSREKFMEINGKDHRYVSMAKERGGVGSPESMADWLVQSSFFDGGKMNHAVWERGWMGIPTQFKGYGFKLLSTMCGLATQGGLQGKLTSALLLAMAVSMSGLGGAPEIDDVEKIWKSIDPTTDFKTTWRRILMNDLGWTQYAADIVINGAGNAVGVPIGRQFSMGGLLPNNADIGALLGPAAAMTYARAQAMNRRSDKGQPLGAAAEFAGLLPGVGTIARNALMATTVYPEEGVQTSYGNTVVPAREVTTGDRIGAAFGITTPHTGTEYEERQAASTAAKGGKDQRDSQTHAISSLIVKRDNAQARGDTDAAKDYEAQKEKILSDHRKWMADPNTRTEDKFDFSPIAIRNQVYAANYPDKAQLKNTGKYQKKKVIDVQSLFKKQ